MATTTDRTPTTGADTDDDSMDAAGWWQLAGLTVLGAAIPLVLLTQGAPRAPWVMVVALSVALAVVMPVARLRDWWRRGGRRAVLATRRWVRAGQVPADVPAAVWRPRVQQVAGDAVRGSVVVWVAAGLAVLWAVLAVTEEPSDWWFALVWATVAVARFVQSRGERTAAVRLLATPTGGASTR